jgi:hypothetical protein
MSHTGIPIGEPMTYSSEVMGSVSSESRPARSTLCPQKETPARAGVAGIGGTTRRAAVIRDGSCVAFSAAFRVVPIRSGDSLDHIATCVTTLCRHNTELSHRVGDVVQFSVHCTHGKPRESEPGEGSASHPGACGHSRGRGGSRRDGPDARDGGGQVAGPGSQPQTGDGRRRPDDTDPATGCRQPLTVTPEKSRPSDLTRYSGSARALLA